MGVCGRFFLFGKKSKIEEKSPGKTGQGCCLGLKMELFVGIFAGKWGLLGDFTGSF